MDLPLIIGHRGAPEEATENTLEAVAAAARLGADGVEVDLRLAADGVVVVIHDHELGRTTSGAGPVRDHDSAALAALGVPRLEEVVAMCDELGLFVNLEVKEPEVGIARTLGLIRPAHGALVSSFLRPALEMVRAEAPHLPRGLLTLPGPTPEEAIAAARSHAAWNPIITTVMEDPSVVGLAHEAGLEVHVWTVDLPAQAEAAVAAGVDAIITNVPGRLREVLDHLV